MTQHVFSLPLTILSSTAFLTLSRNLRHQRLGALDAAGQRWAARLRGPADGILQALTRIGEGRSLAILTLVTTAALLAGRRRREAAFVLTSAAGAGLLNAALKLGFSRARPPSDVRYLVPVPEGSSFPSGHAMGSAGLFVALAVVAHVVPLPRAVARGIAAACVLLAVVIALTRVYFGVHYVTDVLGGELAAAAWISLLTGIVYPRLLPGEGAAQGPEASAGQRSEHSA